MYKVIKILNQKEIVVDYGIANGAVKGQKVRVLQKGEDIYNMDGECLGNLTLIKDELEIHSVYSGFSVCRKVEREEKHILKPFEFTYVETSFRDLNVSKDYFKDQWEEPLETISVGDEVEILENVY